MRLECDCGLTIPLPYPGQRGRLVRAVHMHRRWWYQTWVDELHVLQVIPASCAREGARSKNSEKLEGR